MVKYINYIIIATYSTAKLTETKELSSTQWVF